MAAQKGKLFLLKVGNEDLPETFTTLAGMKSTGMTINNETVDITDKDSAGWRELLGGAGIQNMSLSASGTFKDAASEERLRSNSHAASINSYQIVAGNGDVWQGEFMVTSYERTGEHNGEETFNVSLESAGVPTFTPA